MTCLRFLGPDLSGRLSFPNLTMCEVDINMLKLCSECGAVPMKLNGLPHLEVPYEEDRQLRSPGFVLQCRFKFQADRVVRMDTIHHTFQQLRFVEPSVYRPNVPFCGSHSVLSTRPSSPLPSLPMRFPFQPALIPRNALSLMLSLKLPVLWS